MKVMTQADLARLVGWWKGWRVFVKHSDQPAEAFVCAQLGGHIREGAASDAPCSRCGL